MAPLHQIYLVPGFFGFARLGDLTYFHYVQEALEAEVARLGVRVEVIPVDTLPSGSIIRRGRRLLEVIEASGWERAEAIHLLGHSTGGLDARVLTCPHVQLSPHLPQEAVVKKVKTVVTLATPHYGTPVAAFFTTAYGKNLLQLLSLLTVTASAQVPAEVLSLGMRLVNNFQGRLGITDSLLGQFTEQLLADFNPERRDAVRAFMQEVRNDQGAMLHLTPEGMELFNATVRNHPDIRYVCFISAATPPPRIPPPEVAINPRSAIAYFLYRFMWDMVSDYNPHYPYSNLPADLRARLEDTLRQPLDFKANDGVVPARSMFWGECIGAVRGDHLDVVGHYGRPSLVKQMADWLQTGSGFGDAAFIGLYRQLARELVKG